MMLISMSWGIIYDLEICPKVQSTIAVSTDTEAFLSLTSFY